MHSRAGCCAGQARATAATAEVLVAAEGLAAARTREVAATVTAARTARWRQRGRGRRRRRRRRRRARRDQTTSSSSSRRTPNRVRPTARVHQLTLGGACEWARAWTRHVLQGGGKGVAPHREPALWAVSVERARTALRATCPEGCRVGSPEQLVNLGCKSPNLAQLIYNKAKSQLSYR